MIKGIIFDLDGVLVDTETFFNQQIKEHLKAYDVVYDDALIDSYVGISDPELCKKLDPLLPETISGERFVQEIYDENMANPIDYQALMFPHVKLTLWMLKAMDLKLALASSSQREFIDEALVKMGLEGSFDVTTSGHEFALSKPHPEIYDVTLKRLGLNSDECLAVEDSHIGICSAKAAGLYTLAHRDQQFNIDQSNADALYDDIEEIIALVEQMKRK